MFGRVLRVGRLEKRPLEIFAEYFSIRIGESIEMIYTIKKRTVAVVLAGIATMAIGSFGWVTAQEQSNPTGTGTIAVESGGNQFTHEQAVAKALAEHPGLVNEVEREMEHGRDTWRVEIYGDDDRQWELYYDAVTGELVKSESK